MSATARRAALHLIRHGEVFNPDHLVYATLPGFGLSENGRRQVDAAAIQLIARDVVVVVSSPLQRAVDTAAAIARPHGVAVASDARLIEWSLADRWAGHSWEQLPTAFPGELEAYLEQPSHLPFSAESLDELAARIADAAEHAWASRPDSGDVVVVSHQDPIEAGRRRLTGRDLAAFHDDKPDHATVVSLVPEGTRWREAAVWSPPHG